MNPLVAFVAWVYADRTRPIEIGLAAIGLGFALTTGFLPSILDGPSFDVLERNSGTWQATIAIASAVQLMAAVAPHRWALPVRFLCALCHTGMWVSVSTAFAAAAATTAVPTYAVLGVWFAGSASVMLALRRW